MNSHTALARKTSSSGNVHEVVRRARSMMDQSSKGEMYRHLNQNERLRTTGKSSLTKNKARTESKAFEFCILCSDEEDEFDQQTLLKCTCILPQAVFYQKLEPF